MSKSIQCITVYFVLMMSSVVTFGITTVDLPSSDCNIVYNFITASEPISGGLVDAEVEPGFTCRAQAISNAGYEFSHWSIEAGGLDFPIFDSYGSPYHHSEIIYDDVITVRDSAPVDIVCTLELKPVVDVMITAVFVAVNEPIPDNDGDGIGDDQDIDDDNDGIADVSDEFPLIFDVGDGDTPESLEGYVQIYFAEWWSEGGVWYPTSDSAFTWINRRYPSANYQGIYQWDKETRSYTSDITKTICLNFEEKENDVFFEFTYTVQFSPESTSTIPDHGGGGFFYDARFDLDNNGVSDGLQISSGDAFPAVDSSISLRDIYDWLHSGNSGAGLIPIDILNAYIELNTSKYSLEEIKDLRLGSVMMAVQNGQANLTLSVQESTDLNTWSEASEASIQIPIDTAQSTKFFRFAMPE